MNHAHTRTRTHAHARARARAHTHTKLCGNVIENFAKRGKVCQRSRGGYLSDIVFHSYSQCVYFTLK